MRQTAPASLSVRSRLKLLIETGGCHGGILLDRVTRRVAVSARCRLETHAQINFLAKVEVPQARNEAPVALRFSVKALG